MKLWAGRFQKETDTLVNDFNSSIGFDARLYKQDITGSMAHAAMLGKQGIIEEHEAEKIVENLKEILKDIEEDAPSYMSVYLTGEGVASMRGAKKYLSEQLGKNIEIITPKLPGFVKPQDSSKASLLVMADNLSRFDFGAFIKKLFNGGKK